MATSAQGYDLEQGFTPSSPEQALSYDDWIRNIYPHDGYTDDAASFIAGDNILAKLGNIFSGERTKARESYQTYLNAVNKRNEERALANARAYNEWFESTKYQRAVHDLKKAGLNPWLAVNSGFANQGSATITNTSAKGAEYDMKDQSSALAGLLGAIAKLIAG